MIEKPYRGKDRDDGKECDGKKRDEKNVRSFFCHVCLSSRFYNRHDLYLRLDIAEHLERAVNIQKFKIRVKYGAKGP